MAGSGVRLDREKARRVAQEVLGDADAAMHAALCYIGDRLGIFKAMGRMANSISTLYCSTTSLANHGAGIGIAMGEPKARELAAGAGFSRFQRLPIKDDVVVLFESRP